MILAITLLGALISIHGGVEGFSCAPPEFRGTTPCEIPKCCESGQLTTEVCSGCPTCAAAKDQECGAGFEAFQPDCGRGLSCFTRCAPCKTKKQEEQAPGVDAKVGSQECVFPFKYKGVAYSKCTTVESDNNVPWCAIDIQPNTEVPQDGKHWGDCEFDCPGGEYPCDEQQLFNIRGKCVAQAEERIRIARPYAHEFRSGLNDTNAVRKCSEEHPYVHKRIKAEKCYCLPARNNPDKQEGEGCTKELPQEAPFIFDAANLPGVDGPPPPPPPPDYEEDEIPPPSRGWCFLGGVKDPRYYEPEEHCYDDLQWSETEQKFWSTSACDDVPPEGVPT